MTALRPLIIGPDEKARIAEVAAWAEASATLAALEGEDDNVRRRILSRIRDVITSTEDVMLRGADRFDVIDG